jgi:hypothetical protein
MTVPLKRYCENCGALNDETATKHLVRTHADVISDGSAPLTEVYHVVLHGNYMYLCQFCEKLPFPSHFYSSLDGANAKQYYRKDRRKNHGQ